MALQNIGNDPVSRALAWVRGLGKNAINDTKGIGQGLVQTVKQNISGQNGLTPTEMVGKTAIQMGKGMVNEYSNLVGINAKNNEPILDTNKSIFQPGGVNQSGVTFEPEKILPRMYEHPVNTLLDVIPLAKGVKSLKKASAVEATGEGASLVKPLQGKVKTPVSGTPNVRSLETPPVSDVAAQTYLKGYTIPTGLDVNAPNAAKWMINDKPNISNIKPFIQTVENIKKDVLGKAGDAGVQITTEGALSNGEAAIARIPQIAGKPKQIAAFQSELRRMIPIPETNAQGNIGGAHPLDLYDSIRNIEGQGYAYIDGATDAYGKITKPGQYKVGQAYINTARELESTLDAGIKGNGILDTYKTNPNIVGAFKKFSGNVSNRFVENVQNWSDLRALQKPYLDMSRIIDYTSKAGHTAFANLSGGATRVISGGAGTAVGGAIAGVPGAIAGGIIGSVMEPTIASIGNKLLPPIAQGVAGGIDKMGKMGNIIKTATLAAPGIEGLSPISQQETKTDEENSQIDNLQTGGIMNQSGSNAKYSAVTPLDDGTVMSESQYAQQQQALQAKMGAEKLSDPQAYNEDMARYQQNETQFNSQSNIRKLSNDTTSVIQSANNTYGAVLSADPTFINALSKGFDKLAKEANGKYAGMAANLQALSNMSGVDLSTAKTKEALLSAIDAIVQNQNIKLDTAKTQYFGTTNTTEQKNISSYTPPAPQAPAPPENANAIVGGSLPSLNLPNLNLPNIPQ